MGRILVCIALIACCACISQSVADAADNTVYESMQCGACHMPDTRAAGAPLTRIAKAYQTREKLVSFLKGESDPLIESENWGLMRAQMSRIAALKEDERQALADYILSYRK